MCFDEPWDMEKLLRVMSCVDCEAHMSTTLYVILYFLICMFLPLQVETQKRGWRPVVDNWRGATSGLGEACSLHE
jgi:hypothetical protein